MRIFLKCNFLTILAMLFLSMLLAACAGLNSPTPIPTPDANSPLIRIKVGVTNDMPPYAKYDNEKQEPAGFDIDLMNAVAKKADFYVEFITINAGYNQLITQVGLCQLDGAVSAIQKTDDLQSQALLSEPYFTTAQVLVVKKGNIKITGLDSLAGMTVGTQANSLSALELQKMQGIQPKYFESYHLAFEELINGYIDAVIADHPRAWNYVKIKPNNLKVIGEEFGSVPFTIAVCKDDAQILEKINQGLADIKKDGTLDKLIKEWQLTNFGD